MRRYDGRIAVYDYAGSINVKRLCHHLYLLQVIINRLLAHEPRRNHLWIAVG